MGFVRAPFDSVERGEGGRGVTPSQQNESLDRSELSSRVERTRRLGRARTTGRSVGQFGLILLLFLLPMDIAPQTQSRRAPHQRNIGKSLTLADIGGPSIL